MVFVAIMRHRTCKRQFVLIHLQHDLYFFLVYDSMFYSSFTGLLHIFERKKLIDILITCKYDQVRRVNYIVIKGNESL